PLSPAQRRLEVLLTGALTSRSGAAESPGALRLPGLLRARGGAWPGLVRGGRTPHGRLAVEVIGIDVEGAVGLGSSQTEFANKLNRVHHSAVRRVGGVEYHEREVGTVVPEVHGERAVIASLVRDREAEQVRDREREAVEELRL